MTNWGFDDGQTGDQGTYNNDSPGGLRQFAEKTQRENKELKDQLEKIQQQLTQQSVQSIFNDLGVPAAAKQYNGEADPAKAKAWLDEQRSIFGGATSEGTPMTPVVDTAPVETLTPTLQQQMEAFTQAGQQGTPLGTFEQANANVNDANDLNALLAAMRPFNG